MDFTTRFFQPVADDVGADIAQMAISFYQASSERVLSRARDAGAIARDEDFLVAPENLPGTRCWTPELGATLELIRQPMDLSTTALAQLALCNARLGHAQDLTLTITPCVGLIFAGIPLARADSLRLVSDDRHVAIDVGEMSYHFDRVGDRLELQDSGTVLRAYTRSADMLVTGGLSNDPSICYPDDIAIAPELFASAVENIQDALDFIASVTPHYTSWSRRLIRQVYVQGERVGPIERKAGRSIQRRPGQIMASAPRPVPLQAETIIHESSHQHFYMMQLLAPIASGVGTERSFISPLNGLRREITRYLLAYHVVANMIFFHQDALRHDDHDADIIEDRLRYLRPIGAEYLETISNNQDLMTASANAFWMPSADAVREACHA